VDPDRYAATCARLTDEIGTVIVGQRDLVRHAVICLLTEGHLLIEGVPGLGKTQLVTVLARAVGLDWHRIQFTPDLMPADVVGTQVLLTDDTGRREFRFEAGPVFANLVLADEINRATPKTQSALLEAMQERQVTAGGSTRALPRPFLVLATQNPIDQEGTYPLPEAQLDRFLLKATVSMPSADELVTILDRTTGTAVPEVRQIVDLHEVRAMIELTRAVPVPSHVARFAADLVVLTHGGPGAPASVTDYVRYGSSPRGAQALMLAAKATALLDGRPSVSVDDVRAVAPAALRHRVGLGFEAAVDGISPDQIVEAVLDSAPEPAAVG
jgi:MoxR-like ATPase